jgi:membrane protein implicated in regulation of membrane protease activity
MAWWSWIVLGVILLVGEISLPGGFFMCFFGVGALITSPLVWGGVIVQDWIQWASFSGISLILMLLVRKKLIGSLPQKYNRSDTDTMVGGRAITAGAIEVGSTGKVQFRGTSWSAKNTGQTVIESGASCEIVAVDSLTLLVKSL